MIPDCTHRTSMLIAHLRARAGLYGQPHSPVRWRYRSACLGSTFRIRFNKLSLSGEPVSGRRGPPPSSEGVGGFGIGSPGASRRSGINIDDIVRFPFVSTTPSGRRLVRRLFQTKRHRPARHQGQINLPSPASSDGVLRRIESVPIAWC